MKNYVNSGARVTLVAAAIALSGNVVVVGTMFGVAANNAQVGDDLVIDTVGVFDLTAKVADTATIGAVAYWDDTAKAVTTTATNNTKIGVFIAAKVGATAVARIRLNSSF